METNAPMVNVNVERVYPQEVPKQAGIPINTVKVPVKTCSKCGETFVNGYHGSVGIEFWLDITLVGGIVYWAMRGRGERCPKCKKRKFSVQSYDLSIPIDNGSTGLIENAPVVPVPEEKEPSAPAPAVSKYCTKCGHAILPDSNFCEGCGRKLAR